MSAGPHVLYVTPYYPPAHLGGIERAIQQLALALRQLTPGFQATVLTTHFAFPPRYVPHLPPRQRRPEATVVRWTSRPRAALPLFPFYSCPVTWFSPLELRRHLQASRPDLIHLIGDGWAWGHLWLLALRAAGTALVYTPSFHNMTPSRQWLRLPNRLLCTRAERTIVLTPQEQRELQAVYHASPARLRLVPWGVATPSGPPSRPADEDERVAFASPACSMVEEPEPLRLLCVGRLGRHKGQRWLLETYAHARPHFQRPTRLVLVGKDEGDAVALLADVRRLGLDGEVEIAGELSDAALEEEYRRAALFVLFSQFEAFGLVFLEAMAHGVPVLTHRLGAGASLLTAGALVTAPYARAEAATALIRLVNDSGLRARLSEEARALITGRYSWSRCAAATLQVYQEALTCRRQHG